MKIPSKIIKYTYDDIHTMPFYFYPLSIGKGYLHNT